MSDVKVSGTLLFPGMTTADGDVYPEGCEVTLPDGQTVTLGEAKPLYVVSPHGKGCGVHGDAGCPCYQQGTCGQCHKGTMYEEVIEDPEAWAHDVIETYCDCGKGRHEQAESDYWEARKR